MDKYTELERLSNLKEKGIISESEFELEKKRLLSTNVEDNNKTKPPHQSNVTEAEIKLVKTHDENLAKANKLAATGKVANNYLVTSFIVLLFFLFSYNNLSSTERPLGAFVYAALFGLPSIFILPIFLMRSKIRNAAHQEAKNILTELNQQVPEVDRIRSKMAAAKINIVDLIDQSTGVQDMILSESRRKIILALSSIMLIGFFVPWFSFGAVSMNGMGIFKAGGDYKSCYLIGLLPLLSFLSVIKSAKPDLLSFPAANFIPLFAGLSPYFLLGLLYLLNSNEINTVISSYSQLNKFSRSLGSSGDDLSKYFSQILNIISIGLPMTILASAGIIIFSRKKSHSI